MLATTSPSFIAADSVYGRAVSSTTDLACVNSGLANYSFGSTLPVGPGVLATG